MYYLKLVLLVIIVLLIQISILDVYTFDRVHIDLMTLLVIVVALKKGAEKGAVFGFLVGLFYGLFNTLIFGISAFEFVLVGFVAGQMSTSTMMEPAFIKSVVSGLLTAMSVVFIVIFLKLLNQSADPDGVVLNIALINFVATTLLFLPLEKMAVAITGKSKLQHTAS